jgi:hypothetical protein
MIIKTPESEADPTKPLTYNVVAANLKKSYPV